MNKRHKTKEEKYSWDSRSTNKERNAQCVCGTPSSVMSTVVYQKAEALKPPILHLQSDQRHSELCCCAFCTGNGHSHAVYKFRLQLPLFDVVLSWQSQHDLSQCFFFFCETSKMNIPEAEVKLSGWGEVGSSTPGFSLPVMWYQS